MSDRTCEGCGFVIAPGVRERNKRKWCSDACRVKAYRDRTGYYGYAPRSAVYSRDCAYCGRVYCARSDRGTPMCGGLACKRAHKARQVREYAVRYRERNGRSIRREYGNPYSTTTWISRRDRFAIYERDRWVCQICGMRVDPDADVNSGEAATLDHIEPQSWALVPDHRPSNLRLAHRSCNSARGNRADDLVARR